MGERVAHRKYNSPLREQQAQQTRERILDAATRLIAQGASSLTIPAVAKEAGVAVPTVYRHFADKEALEDGVAGYVREQIGVPEPATTWADMKDKVSRHWASANQLDPAFFAVLLAQVGRQLDGRARRVEWVRSLIADELADLPPEDLDRFAAAVAALFSTPGAVAFRRQGLGGTEGADVIVWLFEAALRGLRADRHDDSVNQ